MKWLFMIGAVLALVAITASAQSPATYGNSPKEVVKQFWKMESSGGRVSVAGWYKAAAFFVAQPSPLTLEREITVVSGDFKVGDPTINEGRTTVSVGCPNCRELGRLDSKLHLTLAPPPRPLRGPRAMQGLSYTYNLVLSDKRWDFEKGGVWQQVATPQQWRLEKFQPRLYISADAAIRYVTEKRAMSHDPQIKSNADGTLAVLQQRFQ